MPYFSQLNILIVEDNPGDQLLVTESLKCSNLLIGSLFYASSIKEALKVVKAGSVDIVLLDLSLPDSSGIQSYTAIKKYTKSTPIVILSGFSDMKLALDAITLGAQDYLIKGDFDEKFLSKTILYSIERVKAEENLKRSEEQKQQEITQAVIAAQENERQKIGRELHDNINQILTSALLYLGLTKGANIDASVYNKMAEELITTAIKEIRSLSHILIVPSFGESKLQEALDHFFHIVKRTTGLVVYKEFTGSLEESIPEKFKLTIYRIVQEQLNNIHKYAAANTVHVKLIQDDKKLTLSIKDDGVGFDLLKKSDGVGLMNIRTRASLFNGKMNIISSPGNGCELTIVFSRRPGIRNEQ